MKLLCAIAIILISVSFILPAYAGCPLAVKIISATPPDKSKDADPSSPIVIKWDKTTYQLPAGLHDFKPMLESINIAGGRYKMGGLLTTEWGIGGKA